MLMLLKLSLEMLPFCADCHFAVITEPKKTKKTPHKNICLSMCRLDHCQLLDVLLFTSCKLENERKKIHIKKLLYLLKDEMLFCICETFNKSFRV